MVLTLSMLAALLNYSATFAAAFFMSLYLQNVKGFDPQTAGLIMVAQPVVMAVFSPFAGKLSIRSSRGWWLRQDGFYNIRLLLLSFLDKGTSVEYIVASLIILGFGFAMFSSPNANAVMSSVEKRFYGVASATLGTMRLTGQMLSMGIATLIVAVYMGTCR